VFNFDSKSSAAADTENNDISELISLAARLSPISELNEANAGQSESLNCTGSQQRTSLVHLYL